MVNQNYIHKEAESRLSSRNACYHLVQDLSSSRLLSKNLKIKTYKTIILPVLSMGVKLVSHIKEKIQTEGPGN
jgi:hypothetical protein